MHGSEFYSYILPKVEVCQTLILAFSGVKLTLLLCERNFRYSVSTATIIVARPSNNLFHNGGFLCFNIIAKGFLSYWYDDDDETGDYL